MRGGGGTESRGRGDKASHTDDYHSSAPYNKYIAVQQSTH